MMLAISQEGFALRPMSYEVSEETAVASKVGSLRADIETQSTEILQRCFTALKKTLKPDDLTEFKAKKEQELIEYHFSIGRWLRSGDIRRIWSPSALLDYCYKNGISHPDIISGIILTSFHRYLNGKDINLAGQIKSRQSWISIPDGLDSNRSIDPAINMQFLKGLSSSA